MIFCPKLLRVLFKDQIFIMVKKRQTLRLALCSRRNLSVVVLGVVTLFALRHDGGLEKLFSFGSSKIDISGVKGMLVDLFSHFCFPCSTSTALTVVCVCYQIRGNSPQRRIM